MVGEGEAAQAGSAEGQAGITTAEAIAFLAAAIEKHADAIIYAANKNADPEAEDANMPQYLEDKPIEL